MFRKEHLDLKYKYLLFDLDHTLLDFDVAEDIALTQLLEEEEEGVEDIQTYKDYYVPMNKALWKDLEQKKITKAALINTRFEKLFAHFGIEKDGFYLAERYQFFLSKQGQTFPGVEDLLKTLLHQGYELYAATNGITYIQTGRLEQSGIASCFPEPFIFCVFKVPPNNSANLCKNELHKLDELGFYFPDDEDCTRWYRCPHYFHPEYQLIRNHQS